MNVRSLSACVATTALAFALTALPTPAAGQTGGVSGKVIDDTGKPAADAEVVLSNPEGIPPIGGIPSGLLRTTSASAAGFPVSSMTLPETPPVWPAAGVGSAVSANARAVVATQALSDRTFMIASTFRSRKLTS